MKKLISEPLFHFLLIGAGLFLLFGGKGGPAALSGGPSGPQSPKIVVTQGDIDQLVETFQRTWQRAPTQGEISGMVDSFIRDEIYYREAVTAGLDRDDSVIRRRMRLKMEFIFEDIAAQREPTDEELLAYMKKDPDSYLADPMMAFRHVFVNTDKRGQSAKTHAQQVLVRLNEGADPGSVGDPFLLNSEMELLPLREIGKQFGEAFSTKLLALEQGKWQGPVRSGFGLHLVFVMTHDRHDDLRLEPSPYEISNTLQCSLEATRYTSYPFMGFSLRPVQAD